jgi:bidirectional [NiFe] hydrogenase diaphorase subunit
MPAAPQTAPQTEGDRRLKMLDAAMRRHHYRADALLEVLHSAQEFYGYLPSDVLVHVGRSLKLPLSRVYGVATFYNLFSLRPRGEHTCIVCMGTACYVKGAGEIVDAVSKAYGVAPGSTTPDGKLSLGVARCVGACGIAPVVILDGEIRGRETKETALARAQARTRPA